MSEMDDKIKQIGEKFGFRITTAWKIFNTEYPEGKFLIDNLIPQVGLILLVGPSKSGKSFFCLQLGSALTTGSNCLGKKIVNPSCCQYFSLEDSEKRQQDRMKRMNITPNENFLIATKWNSNLKGINDLAVLLKECREIKVVFIDTYGRFARGRESTGFQADYDFMSRLKDITEEFQIAIILTHHTRKLKDDNDIYNDISGTVANIAAVDTILLLQRLRNSSKALLSCISRDFPEKTYELKFSENCIWEMVGDASPRASTPERQRILDVLIEHGELMPSQIVEYIKDQTPKNISNLLALILQEGLVEKGSKRGLWRSAGQYSATAGDV
jgi:archaellum biogenesis ATPase FlaH